MDFYICITHKCVIHFDMRSIDACTQVPYAYIQELHQPVKRLKY